MKRLFILLAATLTLCCSAAAQLTKEEEDLMRLYGASEEYIQQQRKYQDILDQLEEAREERQNKMLVIWVLSLGVALVPPVVIGKMILTQKKEERTLGGTVGAIGVALLGGAVLFAVNYGWMTLRLKAGSALNFPVALLLTLALAIGAVFLLKKKDPKKDK